MEKLHGTQIWWHAYGSVEISQLPFDVWKYFCVSFCFFRNSIGTLAVTVWRYITRRLKLDPKPVLSHVCKESYFFSCYVGFTHFYDCLDFISLKKCFTLKIFWYQNLDVFYDLFSPCFYKVIKHSSVHQIYWHQKNLNPL